ncbi:MAG: 4Fe-4S binding protein [Saprospiraceae bacterium]
MKTIQTIGLTLFIAAMLIFTAMLGIGKHKLTINDIPGKNKTHKNAILSAAQETGILGKEMSNIAFVSAIKKTLRKAQSNQNNVANSGISDEINEWDFKIGNWKLEEYTNAAVKSSANGPVQQNPLLWLTLTFGMAILGGLLFIIPKFTELPGIKNNGIYHNSLTKGLKLNIRSLFLGGSIIGLLIFGLIKYQNLFWFIVTIILALLIIYLVLYKEKSNRNTPQRSASPINTGWLGVFAGVYLIGFYILLYWAPAYINNWITMVNPVSKALSGNDASNWFLYGFMYSVIVLVMGIRMWSKYRHNQYQKIRTLSVVFFQTAFAFLIPEILVRFNQPWFDFKNIWPLDYDFFYKYNINGLIESGGLGIFMLVWGIVLIIIGVPVLTYFFGKRWYCSWVCGCGGLAETLGDPFRQLSDKSLRAWKYERYIIHGVLVFAILMTTMVLYSYFTGANQVFFMNVDNIKTWYGFLIGSAFAGIVGTGFYPLMGNRMWCRYGCPLSAYLGLVQRFKSKFRITTNGGQCISCGNCSTYCEMGIDVRSYAQKGQDIVRASCVGCGVCSAVCPRGVLKLENGSNTDNSRTNNKRTIHIKDIINIE